MKPRALVRLFLAVSGYVVCVRIWLNALPRVGSRKRVYGTWRNVSSAGWRRVRANRMASWGCSAHCLKNTPDYGHESTGCARFWSFVYFSLHIRSIIPSMFLRFSLFGLLRYATLQPEWKRADAEVTYMLSLYFT